MDYEVSLRVEGDGGQAAHFESLWNWLRGDPELGGQVRVGRTRTADEAMGISVDMVMILSSSGSAAAIAFGRAIRTWLEQRRSDVSISITRADGSCVTVSTRRVAEVEKILKEVLEFPGAGEVS